MSKPEITAYFHCKLCIKELPAGTSPAEYQKIQCGLTSYGFQVWCKRHDVSVAHFKLPEAFIACGQLVEAYDNGEARGGSVDWSDVDIAAETARKALDRDNTEVRDL